MPSLRWTDNDVYGHASILRTAAGVGPGRHIPFHVQHGWNLGTGWTMDERELLPPAEPRVVWSGRQVEASVQRGLEAPSAIGAPFVYLVELQRACGLPPAPGTKGTVVFPYHGNARHPVVADHRAFVAEVRDREGREVTVCLYGHEWRDDRLRRLYASPGWAVVTMGDKHDALFLARFLALASQHRRAVTNRVCTALFYSCYLGLAAEVYGPVASIEDREEGRRAQNQLRDVFPDLHQPGGMSGADASDLGRAELGHDNRREPDDLRRALRLTPSGRMFVPWVLAGYAGRRAMARLPW